MAKLTEKQRRRWGAMQGVVFETRPLALKALLEQDFNHEQNAALEEKADDLLDLEGWEYEEDENGNWTYDPND